MSMMTCLRSARLVPLIVIVGACAAERAPIDRVQPNYIAKENLAGVWYYQRTIVDMPAANGFTFTGAGGGVYKIVWDIQEDTLFARRTYELIKNADQKVQEVATPEGYRGEVVGAFRIEKHFDIANVYNSWTGEQQNITEENDQDQPWYDRTYMRVDWSENLVKTNDFDLDWSTQESVPYFVQEIDPATGQRHPDAPIFAEDNSYFDFTTKVFAATGTVDYPGYGKIPLCFLDYFVECGPGEYTVRNSFLKATNRQYAPRPYKGKETELYGFFWTERPVYDTQTGIRQQSQERYLNRHNIWKRSYDGQGNEIPVEFREPKPVVYHVNPEWPNADEDPELNAAAQTVANKWNDIFRDAVSAADINPGSQRMFILCANNPVREDDPEECGKAGDTPRLGDLRYSFMAYVPKYMTYRLLGYGPSSTDPETGEILSGNAYVYHHNDNAAWDVMEMIELLNGTRNPETFIAGLDLTEWVSTARGESAAPARTFGLEDAGYLIDRMANGPSAQFWDGQRQTLTTLDETHQREQGVGSWLAPRMDAFAQRNVVRTQNTGKAKLARLAGTPIEAMMVSRELAMGMGLDPRLVLDDAARQQASLVRGGLTDLAKQREQLLEAFAEKRNMYLPGMADDALIGLAREYASSNLSSDEIYRRVRQTIYTAVLAHEVGHTLGLMHNFGASDDAINYFDTYWQLRAADGTVAPRLVDPITENERNARIYDYAYSSIMDYAGRYTIDGAGPGKYDRATIAYGYAERVEVFKNISGVPLNELAEWYDTDGDIIQFWLTGPEAVHYTSFYNRMGTRLYEATNREWVPASQLAADYATAGGKARVPYIYCSHTRSNLSDSCLTRDYGADSAERMSGILEDINSWYILRAFPRGEMSQDTPAYVSRNYGRVYQRLKKWHDLYGLYKDFLPQFYTPAQLAAFYADPATGWGAKTWAVQNAFNYLVQTIMMPDVSDSYGLRAEPDGSTVLAKFAGTSHALGVADARFYSTSWGDQGLECGYQWWECLHHYGFYLDKIMAIYALSDSETNFVARATPEDIREWQISYYSTFGDQLSRINEAMMSQRWEKVAPYFDNGELKFPNYAGDLSDVHAEPVDPMATFTVQLYWQVLGNAYFATNFDQRFVTESQIFIRGTAREPALPPERIKTYTSFATGRSYGAIVHAQRGGGEALIDRANQLLARSTYCDDNATTATGDDDCVAPSGGFTQEAVSAQLLQLTELLDALVMLQSEMDYGNPYAP